MHSTLLNEYIIFAFVYHYLKKTQNNRKYKMAWRQLSRSSFLSFRGNLQLSRKENSLPLTSFFCYYFCRLLQSKISMFTFKRRTETVQRPSKNETIHSFSQERGSFKNTLSLTLRRSSNQLSSNKRSSSPTPKDFHQSFALSYPPLIKSKKLSFQKLIKNRRLLNERGKQINEPIKKQKFKMITLKQFKDLQQSENNPYAWQNRMIEAASNNLQKANQTSKTEINCRGLSFQAFETSCDEEIRPSQGQMNKKTRKEVRLRMTEPFDKYKRASTMPQFKQEVDIMLSPWQAGE